MDIKISVVIPTYNRPGLLLKCLQALTAQSLQKKYYEVIVVTDGPDIETRSIVHLISESELFFNVFCYSLDEKKGPAAARNKGAAYAKGKLVVFTDDDCLPQQDWLTAYLNSFEAVAENEAAFSGRTIVPRPDTPTDYENNIAHLEKAEFITANCAITKAAFDKLGGFDEAFPIAWREDSDMHFRLLKNNIDIHDVSGAIVVHPVRKANWGISIKEQKKSLFNALLYKKHEQLYRTRISARPLWEYYLTILLFVTCIVGVASDYKWVGLIAFSGWLALFIKFCTARLRTTSKKATHVLEMVITSFIIPFLSVFWTLYGAVKYRTFFL